MTTTLPKVQSSADNFVNTINSNNENIPTANRKKTKNIFESNISKFGGNNNSYSLTTLKNKDVITSTSTTGTTNTTASNSGQRSRRGTLGDMKSFLASFNKQQDKTRQLLSDMKTPTNTHSTPTLSIKAEFSSSSKHKAKAKAKFSGDFSKHKIKHAKLKSQSLAEFFASDHHFENNHGSLSPSAASWIEGLRRMREKKNFKKNKSCLTPGAQQTPTSIRDQCPVEAHKKERIRLARRLSTLSFPMKACIASLEECNGDIEKSVALLLRWYPKGSGGRGAVQNLVKIILGAEKKLKSLRAKLQILYAPEFNNGETECETGCEMTNAVRNIFNRYDEDGSGTIDHQEFRKMMSDLGVEMSRAEFQEAVSMLDNDRNGTVDFEEFLGWWKQNAGNGVVLSSDIDSLFKHVLSEAKSIANADKASLLLVDHHKGELWSRICEDDLTIRMPMFKGIAGHVVRTGQILNVPGTYFSYLYFYIIYIFNI